MSLLSLVRYNENSFGPASEPPLSVLAQAYSHFLVHDCLSASNIKMLRVAIRLNSADASLPIRKYVLMSNLGLCLSSEKRPEHCLTTSVIEASTPRAIILPLGNREHLKLDTSSRVDSRCKLPLADFCALTGPSSC